MKEPALTKIQYFRKESESSSTKPSQKNDENPVKQKETKVHCAFLVFFAT